ncbi:MAG: hypothetical protein GC204_05795 [Chloroflexi bacterium]|nr:hypothetical protein [Chloroflexota bacterium]
MANTCLRVTVNYRNTEISVIQNDKAIWKGEDSFGVVDWIFDLVLHLRFERDLLVGRYTAEKILLDIGAVIPLNPIRIMKVKGRNLKTGFPAQIELTSEDVRRVIQDARGLVWYVSHTLSADPPPEGVIVRPPVVPLEFRAAIVQQPIELSGEFAQIRGLDQRLEETTGLKIILLNNKL